MTKFLIIALLCAPGWLLGGRVQHHAPTRHPTPTARATRTPLPTMTAVPTTTPAPTNTPLPTATAVPTPTPECWADYDRCLLGLLNGERHSHGIAPLTLNVAQSACSLAHSVHMAAEGYISHDQFPADVCVPWSAAGENVGESPGPEQSAILADFQQMLTGPGETWTPGCIGSHHCNIDSAVYHQIGIGIYQSGGLTWVTEDFTN